MSYRIGIDTIHLRPTPRLAHTDYCSNAALKRVVTGMAEDGLAREAEFYRQWDFDFIWSTNNGPVPWEDRGRVTDMGHSDFLEGGVDRRQPKPCPFTTVEEAWAFDAVAEYGLTDYATLVDYYEQSYQQARKAFPDQVFTGGYYRTLISGAIAVFGWDMLLVAASDRTKFAQVLATIYEQTLHHYRAWADTSIEVFMCHDDMVWSNGPFMHPDFYRAEIFPRYKELWALLKRAGKKVVFTSDGDYSMFMDDIVDAGADVLCFEPLTPLEPVVAKYGQTHGIIASKVDARTLTFGSQEQIRAEVEATIRLAQGCPGFMVAVGNHIPSNVPVVSALFYMQCLRERWSRSEEG